MLLDLSRAIELQSSIKTNAAIDSDFKEYWNDTDFQDLIRE